MPPQMKKKTLEQLLKVLSLMKGRINAGDSLREAFQHSIRRVGQDYNITHNTVSDICWRRLGLHSTDDFLDLFQAWLDGNAYPIIQSITSHTHSENHKFIQDFFSNSSDITPPMHANANESICINLDINTLSQIRILSNIEGKNPEKWIIDFIQQHLATTFVDKTMDWIMNLPMPQRKIMLERLKEKAEKITD